MTTTRETTTIGRLLRDKRGTGYKSEAARKIGVSRQVYDAWESGHFIPGDEWAEPLATYLDRPLEEVVLRLYNDRTRKRDPGSPIIDAPSGWTWFDRPIDVPVAA